MNSAAALDLFADRGIPSIPTPQLALIEPHLNARGAQSIAKLLRGLRILRSIA